MVTRAGVIGIGEMLGKEYNFTTGRWVSSRDPTQHYDDSQQYCIIYKKGKIRRPKLNK